MKIPSQFLKLLYMTLKCSVCRIMRNSKQRTDSGLVDLQISISEIIIF